MAQKQHIIGFLSQAWTLYCTPQFAGVVEYVTAHPALTLRDMRYNANPQTPDQLERGHPPWTGLVDGMITSEGVERDPKETADWMLRGGVPVINLGADLIDPRIPFVHTNYSSIGQLAAEHFLAMGIRHFAAVGFVLSQASRLRRDAFNAVLRGRGYSALSCDLRAHLEGIGEGERLERGEKGLIHLLKSVPKPLGVLTVNDSIARAVCRLALEMGLAVPEDVAVLGVGNSELCWSSSPSLSSIRTPGEAIGFNAARLLHDILRGRPAPTMPLQIPCLELITRQSTLGAAPRRIELDRAIEFIRNHACEGIDVEQVMQTVTMSRRSLEQLFLERVGRPPGKEIQRLRFERAEHLLKQTDLSISRIAQMIGFAETSAFSKFFRKLAGLPPAKYRAGRG